ncbi:MAG: purine-binding chemotaxis protein CheW [Deltaproteobacteria bacterium]|jgi:purine-binding chemotaxis protein CheW|nr:purine-binding chemotaxis protein CheW [Deltaproteobacteria bacterium]MBT4015780.1 purine-binding chemotaxis protein CheW [Deltaproteobacteria bacterium]MBT4630553.1 purine-binding chemotaxis protein CheW [Deltaproteobacteria bacterium]MBT5086005.1 purine-binding chemotaxis protein CheW [Deltaproteobacteria bacterium]MBT5486356.1 purine-binding chemotaxis protein CheW [Deltaproteobacteria bacterium]|tara:strand:- start:119 stop:670 length:552 start_codon:yes stop_codon:yes gene_type:complete
MENNKNKKYLGTVSLSDEELEDMSLDISYSEGTRLITFILGQEKYGLDILKVRELISFPEGLTRIPRMPDFIVGMFNLRGLVIPVMDLRKKFNMSDEERHEFSVIIIVDVENKYIGLTVDAVSDVIFVKEDEMQDTSELAVNVDTKFIKGVAKTKDEMIILLDIDYLLSKEEFDTLIENKSKE